MMTTWDSVNNTIYAYESGVSMASGAAAPHRRVGFFLYDTTASVWNTAGEDLFKAAVDWAINGGSGFPTATPTPTPTLTPTPAVVANLIEGENFTSSSLDTNAAASASVSGYSGTGYADFGGNNSYAIWDITADSTASYTLSMTYANGNSQNRRCEIFVNNVEIGQVNFASTGGWSTWQAETITIPLNAGTNTIEIRAATGQGGPNVDFLTWEIP